MSFERDTQLLRTYRELREATRVNLKIDHDMVCNITVADLLEKYRRLDDKRNPEHKDILYRDAFRKVLSYYLTEEEVKFYLDSPLEELLQGA